MGLALEESVEEEKDEVEKSEGISIVYEKGIESHVNDKVIDYVTSPRQGFIIAKEGPDKGCGSCSC